MGVQSLGALLLAPVLAAVAAWPGVRPLHGLFEAPRFSRADVPWLLAALLLVPALVGWPYARVGELTEMGEHYRAYFTADFVWAMAAVAEVAKGSVPPG